MPARSPSYYSSRTRSRTRSPYTPRSRGRSRSRSRDSRYSYYSNSFHSDDSRGRGHRSRSRTPPRGHVGGYNKSKFSGATRSKVNIPKFKAPAKRKPVKKSGAATSTPRPAGAHDVVTRRMLSARRLKINELRNEIDTLMKALEGIRLENKSLKRDNILQNKQLDRLQDQEGDLPMMIESHTREVRTLKEQIRKLRDKTERVNKNLRNAEDELSRSQRKVKKLQGIADDKKLEERDELSRRLGKSENDLEERSVKVQHLERHIENLEKTHRREILTEMKKHATTKLELETLHADLEYTKIHLRDREKELEVRNIYQNRIALAQRKGSISSLPALEPPARYQPPPKSPEISPRHRIKQFEQKRREEQKAKTKELTVRTFNSPNTSAIVPPIKSAKKTDHPIKSKQNNYEVANQTQKQRKAATIDETAIKQDNQSHTSKQSSQPIKSQTPKPPDTPKFETEDSWEAIVKKQQKISGQPTSVTKDSLDDGVSSSFNKRLAEESRRIQQEEEEEEKKKRHLLEENRRKQEKQQEEDRRREKEERDRHEREEKERRAREDRERYERDHLRKQKEELEEREKSEQKAREAADRERNFRQEDEQRNAEKEADERARIAREQDKRRLETDANAAEERRKKDLLLQRMKEIDSGSSAPPPNLGAKSKPTSFGNSSSKDLFASDGGDFFLTSGDDKESQARNKDYNFRKTDENLYRGLPANKSGARNSNLFGDEGKKGNSLFGSKKDSLFGEDEDLDFGGYQPSSFGGSNKPKPKPEAETNNTWKAKDSTTNGIFGETKSRKQPSIFDDSDDLFPASQKPKPTAATERKSEFSWGSDTKPTSNDKILPLRPRADHTTIHNKPTVRAIDGFDDDLEEVVL